VEGIASTRAADPVAAHEASLSELKKASRSAGEEMEVEEAAEAAAEEVRFPVVSPPDAAVAAAAARQGGRTEAG